MIAHLTLLFAACTHPEIPLVDAGHDGGAAGYGAGGSAPDAGADAEPDATECKSDDQCAHVQNECAPAFCAKGKCGVTFLSKDTSCGDGTQRCDGFGNCCIGCKDVHGVCSISPEVNNACGIYGSACVDCYGGPNPCGFNTCHHGACMLVAQHEGESCGPEMVCASGVCSSP